jgi:hypothetical protein
VSAKNLLIITDGTEAIQLLAQSIKKTLIDYEVKICSAEKFDGTDLLAVQVFLLGCEKPKPVSFTYITDMLSHINLAGRKCGTFSTDKTALNYLGLIVKDSEVTLGEPLLINTNDSVYQSTLKNWLEKTISNQQLPV